MPTAYQPYLSLSGTSMAAPVVADRRADAPGQPELTPNVVKASCSTPRSSTDGYNALTQGAGFLNALGAVRLARFYATASAGRAVSVQSMWSKHIIWGNHR